MLMLWEEQGCAAVTGEAAGRRDGLGDQLSTECLGSWSWMDADASSQMEKGEWEDKGGPGIRMRGSSVNIPGTF